MGGGGGEKGYELKYPGKRVARVEFREWKGEDFGGKSSFTSWKGEARRGGRKGKLKGVRT